MTLVVVLATMNQYEKLASIGSELRKASPADFRVLDVGAGHGAEEYSPYFADLATHYVGVDPDEDINQNKWIEERYHMPAEDFAAKHESRVQSGEAELFDLATAVYVWEHLPNPTEFLSSVVQVLRPGGILLCVTPNGLHPFGLGSKVLAKFDLTDKVLHKLRPDEIDHYHFPVVATQNTPGGVNKAARAAGFTKCEIILHDEPEVFMPYLPDKLHFLPKAYSKVIGAAKLESLSGTLIIKLTK